MAMLKLILVRVLAAVLLFIASVAFLGSGPTP